MRDELSDERVAKLEAALAAYANFIHVFGLAPDGPENIKLLAALIADWRARCDEVALLTAERDGAIASMHRAADERDAAREEIAMLRAVADAAEAYIGAGGYVLKSRATPLHPEMEDAQERWFEKEDALKDTLDALRGAK